MKTGYSISHVRRIIGDVLVLLAVLLMIDVIVVMSAKIRAVVQKKDYQEVFFYINLAHRHL